MTAFSRFIGMLLMLGLSFFTYTEQAYCANNKDLSTILSIDVEGSRFVEKQAVLARMKTQLGQKLKRKTLSRDVRKLYKAGFFSDVRFTGTRTPAGIKLVCHVVEYPLIAKLRIEGNDEHTSKDLKKKLTLKAGAFFNPKNREKDRNKLRKGYLKDGFYQNSVSFISTPAKDGRVDVLIKIHEGEVTRISRIHFIGNHAYSTSQLRDIVASRQTDLVNTIMKRDVFNKKKFGADIQLLQQYYMNHGFLDMKVDSEQLTLSADKSTFALTFSIHEGIQYRIDKLDITGDITPDKATLLALLAVETGDIYAMKLMRASIEAITSRVGDEGYAFASVTPLLKRDIDAHNVSINFDIDKGKKVYVERIEITGNEKTEDIVVRRLVRQSEGSRYQGTQVQHTREGIGRAPMVDDVRVSLSKTNRPDQVNMKVKVKEKKTGSISGGIGYSQREKVILTAKVSESNFLGKGYQTNINGQFGKITQNISASFTDPYFLNSDISASVNVTQVKTDPLTTVTYNTNRSALGFGFGVPITLDLSYNISYNFSKTTLSGVPANSSQLIQAQEGRTTIGELTQSFSWDSRDRLTSPKSGQLHSISLSYAGLGGATQFIEGGLSAAYYKSLDKDGGFVLNPSVEYRMIRQVKRGVSVPLWRRYSLGGIGSLRGFDSSGVSLRDTVTGEAIGGDSQFRASVNQFFPLPYMQTSGFRGLVFADAGTVWGKASGGGANVLPEAFSFARMRYAAGFGIEWLSPIGPVGFSWAFPLRTMAGDVQRTFEFALGSQF
ncbi:MAG: outer membrane protein assembly factor BamA [Mariprofundus sp.]|nr:outer membrane protein assembly factor BamA [Mariprofundus sp.]